MLDSPTLSIMRKAADKASRALVRDFGEIESLQVSKKGPRDFVTNADIRTEKVLVEELRRARPEYGFLMEESGSVSGTDSEYRWIIDPIDGTTNFLHGLPYFCISIALEKRLASGKSEIIAGLVQAPILRETFYAEKGKGAFFESLYEPGKKRLRVANRNSLKDGLVVMGSFTRGGKTQQQWADRLVPVTVSTRCNGAAALDMAYVAAGRFDLFLQHNLEKWDIAAAMLLIQESGGVITAPDGKSDPFETGHILAGNAALVAEAVALGV